jgi:hypothetical protein
VEVNYFNLSRCFVFDVDSALASLQAMKMCSGSDVSEINMLLPLSS